VSNRRCLLGRRPAAHEADGTQHEVVALAPDVRNEPGVQFGASHHSSPSDAARVFARAKPRLAVLTRVAPAPDRQRRPPSLEAVLKDVSDVFTGRVEVGEDLMRIVVGEAIEVQRRQPR